MVPGRLDGTSQKPTAKRSADGCQMCRVNRVKCDRGKPVCGVCTRRKHNCDYSKIQFNTVNKSTHDRRTGRRPHAASSRTQNVATTRGGARSSEGATQNLFSDDTTDLPQLLTPGSSPHDYDSETHRSSNIHQLLWPENFPGVQGCSLTGKDIDTEYYTCPLIQEPVLSPLDDLSATRDNISSDSRSEDAWGVSFESVLNYEDDMDLRLPSIIEPGNTAQQYSLAREVPIELSYPSPRFDLASFPMITSPQVRQILQSRNARFLLHHYLHRSVATLHPQQGCTKNLSANLLLPYSLSYPVALEGILAFSAAQLVVDDPRQSQALLYHKMSSVRHLNRLVYQQAFPTTRSERQMYSLDLMIAVLTQISLSVSESGTDTWQMHCGAAYSMLALLPRPQAAECHADLQAYIYCRLLKYICFAEIAKPTNKKLDLSLIQGANLDVGFGVPSTGLKIAVLISRYAYNLENGNSPEALDTDKNEIEYSLRDYIAFETHEELDLYSDSRLMEAIWRTAVWLYYNRSIMQTDFLHDSSISALSHIVRYLKLMSLDSIYGTALAFPILMIVPLITDSQPEIRFWLGNYCKQLAKTTNTRNFLRIEEFSWLCWAEMDKGALRTIAAVHALAAETGYLILTA